LEGTRFRIGTISGKEIDTTGTDLGTTGTISETTKAEQIDWLPQEIERLGLASHQGLKNLPQPMLAHGQ